MPIERWRVNGIWSGEDTAFLVAGFLRNTNKDRFFSAHLKFFLLCGNNCCLVKGVIAIDIDEVIINYKNYVKN
jgi:hypothetical protein